MDKLIAFMTELEDQLEMEYMKRTNAKAHELYPDASEIEICRILSACNQKRAK